MEISINNLNSQLPVIQNANNSRNIHQTAPVNRYNSVINRTSIDSYAGRDKDTTGETGNASGINTLINFYKTMMLPFFDPAVMDYTPTRSFLSAMTTLYQLATIQSNNDAGTLTP